MTAPVERALRSVSSRPWLLLVAGCVLLVAVTETALLHVATTFLGSGYNNPRIDPTTFGLGYLPSALVLDLWLVSTILAAVVPVLSRLSSSRLRVLCCAALIGAGLPLAVTGIRYNAYSILGGMFGVALLSRSSTLSSSGLLAETLSEAPGLVWGSLLALVALLCAGLATRWVDRRFGARIALPPAPLRGLSLLVLGSGAASVLVLAAAALTDSPLGYGFQRKFSGSALFAVMGRLTDVDGDGFGAFVRPRDPAPFDPSIHPYAVDAPGNGIDENGIGGDHPAGLDIDGPAPTPAPVGHGRRPHVLLVYLESFRHDLLGARVGDREVTPFLNRLAREGGSSERAYVEAPWTLASRKHLFIGSLRLDPGSTTLVDDFKSRGYTVAWFSGQDDSYGDSAHLLGAERADRFYDARQDLGRRTSRSTAPISLQVSWKTLTARALDYIAQVDPEQPLFFYLNVVDTHFPYTNHEIDRLLDVESLARDDINEQNVARVRDTYANTAANVDRAVEIVFDALRWRLGDADLAVVVTSDHGQAFYEYERLGHGQTLDSLETQVPFIVWGLGGDWPEPIGASDVRPLLLGHLETAGPAPAVRPRFVPDGARRLFQYAPDIEKPRYIALRGCDDSLLYDFARDGSFRIASADVGGAAAEPRPQQDVRELIWRWEALQRHAIEPEPRTARSARIESDSKDGSPRAAHGG